MLLDVMSKQVQPFLDTFETTVQKEVPLQLTQAVQQESASARTKQVPKTGRVVKARLTDTKGAKEQVQGSR